MVRVIVIVVLSVLGIVGTISNCAKAYAQEWVARYNGPADSGDYANAIAVDNSGYVYVTGYSYGSGTDYDYVTIKYNSLGDTVWVKRYNGPGNGQDAANAIAVDDSGNVYVTGESYGSDTSSDYATIKYNSSGDTLWVRSYNGPGNGDDWASAIAIDGNGNVYVTGASGGSGTYYDYATIKYNSAGDTVWVRRYNGPGNSHDDAYAIAIDGNGNVYVTGASGGSGTFGDCATIKYNVVGDIVWVRRYNGPGNQDDAAHAIAVDDSGNAYVTGTSWDEYVTIKYNSAGVEQWVRKYNGPGNGGDGAYAIAIDGSNNVYVTGWSVGPGNRYDYATIKYNSAGDTVWVRRYNGTGNQDDHANAIAVDDSGNVYVTGAGEEVGTYDYTTIKYNSAGDTVWVRRYNGPGNSSEWATAIAVDENYVYVTGGSYGSGTNYDYATIKYNPQGVEEKSKTNVVTQGFSLEIQPNPSFGNAVIKYGLPKKASIRLKLYDISGRLVNTIYSGIQEKGSYEVNVSRQIGIQAGIYFIRLEADEFKLTRKLTIFK